jgi:hypothetical protein
MAPGTDSGARSIEELKSAILRLRGMTCWSVVAGRGSGSQVKLDFGQRLPRRIPVRNPVLREDQRIYEGEFDLFVQCAWRLEHNRNVLCTSTSDDRTDGPMIAGLYQLTNQVVIGVGISEPVPDLVIQFSDEFVFRLFCDQTGLEDGGDNYSFRFGEAILAVDSHGTISYEPRISN